MLLAVGVSWGGRQSACPELIPLPVLTRAREMSQPPHSWQPRGWWGTAGPAGQGRDLLKDGQRCKNAKSTQGLVAGLAGMLVVWIWAWETEGKRGLSLRFPIWDQVRVCTIIVIS